MSWKMFKKDGKEDYNQLYPVKICERKDFEGSELYFDRLNKQKKNSLLCLDDLDKYYLDDDRFFQQKLK